jgi:hypothetical protein
LDDLAQKVADFVFFGCGRGGGFGHKRILGLQRCMVDKQ